MAFLQKNMGLIDMIPGAELGGNYVENPRYGQLSAGFERADVRGTLTTTANVTTTTALNERMVTLHRTLYTEYFQSTTRIGSVGPEAYSAEMGRQIAIKAGHQVLSDIYGPAIAAAATTAIDHEHDVYVNNTTAANQVDLTVAVLQAAKFKMTDHMESLDIAVCHSKQWNDLRVDLLTATAHVVPNIVGELVRGNLFKSVLGVTFIVDDQIGTAAGPTSGSPLKHRALLFRSRMANPNQEAPVMMSFQRPLIIHEQHVLGEMSRRDQLQAEMAYAVGFRGFGWDSTNGGENPSDAALILESNWDEANDDDEQHGIVSVITN